MAFFAAVQESREDETNLSPNEDKDEDDEENGDDYENDLDEFERESVTGMKMCTMKSCIGSFIKG